MVDILTIENDIVTKLAEIQAVNGNFYSEPTNGSVRKVTQEDIYREPNAYGLSGDIVVEPCIVISNSGYSVPNDDPVGCSDSQQLTSLWTVAIVCRKEDYITKCSPLMMQIIKKLKGYKGVDDKWRHKMKVHNDVRNFAKPDIDVTVAHYPIVFGLKIII